MQCFHFECDLGKQLKGIFVKEIILMWLPEVLVASVLHLDKPLYSVRLSVLCIQHAATDKLFVQHLIYWLCPSHT